jgi:hypothetical protein
MPVFIPSFKLFKQSLYPLDSFYFGKLKIN